ncbi:MAG: sigma-70 family RNA polymerase sigma factor [Cyanobacteria bacterium P01_F01_bin.42]
MKLTDFLESSHPLISPLLDWDDTQLVAAFQQRPQEGKFFVAIFCKYAALTYSLLVNKAPTQIQVEYMFAKVWRNLFLELRSLSLEQLDDDASNSPTASNNQVLQGWIFNRTALSIHTEQVPSIEAIPYSMDVAPLPFWCYVQTALDSISPLSRLTLVLTQTFRWPQAKILSFLAAEGTSLTRAELAELLTEAQTELNDAMPTDIQDIYGVKESAA